MRTGSRKRREPRVMRRAMRIYWRPRDRRKGGEWKGAVVVEVSREGAILRDDGGGSEVLVFLDEIEWRSAT